MKEDFIEIDILNIVRNEEKNEDEVISLGKAVIDLKQVSVVVEARNEEGNIVEGVYVVKIADNTLLTNTEGRNKLLGDD